MDNIFVGGTVERRLNYFNVPVLAKYRIGRFFAGAGPQLSLGYKGADVFTKSVKGDEDLTYTLENRAQYKPIEAGICAAAGVHLQKGYGMNILVRYYQGLTEIRKEPVGAAQVNQGWHLLVGIPIGMGKAQERMRQKEEEQQGQ